MACNISTVDLSTVPTGQLRAELARRERQDADEALVIERPQKWVCRCGNVVYGGGDISKLRYHFARAWCRVCYPRFSDIILYEKPGVPASVPMVQMDAN